ncbi:MAG: S4 domain-containing protein YaaA [Bacilli bacterium]|nr:S4 domain-containing protein YaaA [Bacilli bacterium]
MDSFEIVKITTPYITLGQLLKFKRIVGQGGEEKLYLATHKVLVNGEEDNRRGRKLYPGDRIRLEEGDFEIGR